MWNCKNVPSVKNHLNFWQTNHDGMWANFLEGWLMLSYTAGSQPLYDFKEGTCIQYTLFPFHTQVTGKHPGKSPGLPASWPQKSDT